MDHLNTLRENCEAFPNFLRMLRSLCVVLTDKCGRLHLVRPMSIHGGSHGYKKKRLTVEL
jgi:hypothetical protein